MENSPLGLGNEEREEQNGRGPDGERPGTSAIRASEAAR
jgi:hypothetical protein